MTQWRFKACARCSGDVFIDRDMDGWYEQCLQCGYRRELEDLRTFKRRSLPVGAGSKSSGFDREDWSQEENES